MLKKIRRRYLGLEIDSEVTIHPKEFIGEIWNAVLELYGEYGASQCGLKLVDYDVEKRFAIIRTAHTTVDIVRAALVSITHISDTPVAIHVQTVSGTIKSLKRKMRRET